MAQKPPASESETELKITVSPTDMERVFDAFSKRAGATKVTHKYMPRMYYDTNALDLHARNISLRVQYKSGVSGVLGFYEQTTKFELPPLSGGRKGLLFRRECKDRLEGHLPDIDAISDPAAQKETAFLKGKKLVHIFTAAIERRFFEIPFGKGKEKGVLEVAFDTGHIFLPGDERALPFCEIEVELKKGDVGLIAGLFDEIAAIAPSARVQPQSKAEQGVAFRAKTLKKS